MDKIKVILVYPEKFNKDYKELELTQTGLTALLLSQRVDSEKRCFAIKHRTFVDTQNGYEIRIHLGKSMMEDYADENE